ncbi:MAG: hypothetical protein V3R99_12295 [Thermoguttaceae bacterium]
MSQGCDEFRSKSGKRHLRGGLIVSLLFHVAVVIDLLIYRPWRQEKPAVDSPQRGTTAATASSDAAADHATAAKNPLNLRTKPIPRATADQIAAKLAETIDRSEQLTEEDNLDELDEQIRRLEQVASQESIDQLSNRFQGWLKTRPRVTAPAETPIEGHFDLATAQLLEVKRTRDADGEWTYRAVLIDARSRTTEAPMDPAKGARAFRTLQLLKTSPLAESLYRRITLPLLDKMLFDPTKNDSIYSESDRE